MNCLTNKLLLLWLIVVVSVGVAVVHLGAIVLVAVEFVCNMRCLYNGLFPCGKCPACLLNRQRAFCFRLDQEKENASFYYWLTLQYSDDHVPKMTVSQPNREYVKHDQEVYDSSENEEFMCFSKSHCRKFFEKLRKRYKSKEIKFKHFLVSEYGPNFTKRPHYHLLLLVYCENRSLSERLSIRKEIKDFIINKAWFYGHVTEKSFHGRVISYLTKYCLKPELIGDYHPMKPFTLISKGLGLCYLDKLSDKQKSQMIDDLDFTVFYHGSRIQLSRYYTDRLLPHSKKDLEDAVDSPEYYRLLNIRAKLGSKQTELARKNHVKRWQGKKDTYELLREEESHIGYAWSDFKQKLKKRKDL